jgi:hypothetical protein
MKWKQYQVDVAELLRSLGFTVTIEAKVMGARGAHMIDVHATQTAYGFPITWIMECKYWNKAVPKEKVLVLSQIVADVGADRGFLLSESGFQSGAISATHCTNVTLASLPDLRENTQAELTRIGFVQISLHAFALEKTAQRDFHPGFYKRADGLGEKLLQLLARIFALKSIALPSAQAGVFPVQLLDGIALADPPAFLAAAQAELKAIACELEALIHESTRPSEQVPNLADSFTYTVNNFLDAAQHALAASSAEDHERRCMEVLLRMQRIGNQASSLEFMLQPEERQALNVVMQRLVNGPYLLVNDLATMPSDWVSAAREVEFALSDLHRQVRATRANTQAEPPT